jgi:hypothetical protein
MDVNTMKILFVGSSKFDYLQDLTLSGLTGCLNREQLYLYPKFRLDYLFLPKNYPKNLGYSPKNKRFIHSTIPWGQLTHVLIASCKKDCFEKFLKIEGRLSSDCKVIFIDGSDREEIAGDAIRLNFEHLWELIQKKRRIHRIFKREMIKGRAYQDHIHPLPFSAKMDHYAPISVNKKVYDVTFWAVESHPIRTKALELIEKRFDCENNGTTKNQVFSKYKRKGRYYLEELQRSKIALNLRGGGWDTLRLWELGGLGVFTLAQKLEILIPNDYRDGVEIVYLENDLSDLIEKCEYYLHHLEEREQIEKAFLEKTKKYHTTEKRAQYILDIIK